MTVKFCFALWLANCLLAADYDVLIRNARVIDGTGNPWFRADIGVKDGRVGAIGDLSNGSAARVMDARERVAAPGFIDVHTHIEETVEKIPGGDNFVMDGVTTVVTGNCGGSEADLGAFFGRLEKLGLGHRVVEKVASLHGAAFEPDIALSGGRRGWRIAFAPAKSVQA